MIKDGSPPLMVLPPQTVMAKKGHAAYPGTGPKGETCGSCRHLTRHRPGARTYSKCALVKLGRSVSSDSRQQDPACARWEAPE